MERVQGFDVARGIGVVLVVALHAASLPQVGVDLPQPICRMGLMLIISGAVAAPALTRGWVYSRDRGLDLLWPFALWTPIVLLGIYGLPGLLTVPHELIVPGTPLWYIAGLACMALSVPLVRRVPPAVLLTVTGAASVGFLAGYRTGVLGYDQMMHFTVFFYIGLYSRRHLLTVLARCGTRVGWVSAALLIVIYRVPLPHTLVTMTAAALLLLVAQSLSGSVAGPALVWLGRNTLPIYLAHDPLLFIGGRLIGPMNTPSVLLLAIVVIVTCLALNQLAIRIGLGWLYRRPPMVPLQRLVLQAFVHEVRPVFSDMTGRFATASMVRYNKIDQRRATLRMARVRRHWSTRFVPIAPSIAGPALAA